jgi:hypothetical protein
MVGAGTESGAVAGAVTRETNSRCPRGGRGRLKRKETNDESGRGAAGGEGEAVKVWKRGKCKVCGAGFVLFRSGKRAPCGCGGMIDLVVLDPQPERGEVVGLAVQAFDGEEALSPGRDVAKET